MASAISSAEAPMPDSPASTRSAGRESITLGVEISVALRMSVPGLESLRAAT